MIRADESQARRAKWRREFKSLGRERVRHPRTRFQELMAEIQKAVMSKSEAFVHALNSFMEAGYSLRNLLK